MSIWHLSNKAKTPASAGVLFERIVPTLVSANSCVGWRRQKLPESRQQRLKQPPGTAGAGIITSEFLQQLFVTVDHAMAFLDPRFGREAFAAFTGDLETAPGFRRGFC